METVTDFVFCAPKSLQMVISAMKLKDTCSLDKISQEFSTWGDYAPRGHLENLQIFLIFTAWGGEVLLRFDG